MDATLPWLIVGTVPIPSLPVQFGEFTLSHETLSFPTAPNIPLVRGTAALLAAQYLTCTTLGYPPPYAAIVGDRGGGNGSRALYGTLISNTLQEHKFQGITFHYCYPDVDWHNRILLTIESLPEKPILVADAGFMYAAKMSGYAASYDLFTPDRGELAFLADPSAPHPFYTRGFFLEDGANTMDLIRKAYAAENAASWLLVKGKHDWIVHTGILEETVEEPEVPAMEAIGGTGDLVTGVASGLLASGFSFKDACVFAAIAARTTGQLAKPTPATQVATLLETLPTALRTVLAAR